jgi:hypothetical protein
LLPWGNEYIPSEDLLFSHSFTYKENPNVETPKYHLPLALNDFTKYYDFELERFFLADGGGIPPSLPNSPPLTPKLNPEKNLKMRKTLKVSLKEKHIYS